MIETKTIQVHPDKENEAMSLFTKFGWEIKNNQRCQEFIGLTTYTFNKITVSRDDSLFSSYDDRSILWKVQRKIRNIEEISKLDSSRPAKPKIEDYRPGMPSKPSKKFLLFALLSTLIILAGIGGVLYNLFVFEPKPADIDEIISRCMFIMISIPGIVGFIIFMILHKKRMRPYYNRLEYYEIAMERYNNHPDEILKEPLEKYENEISRIDNEIKKLQEEIVNIEIALEEAEKELQKKYHYFGSLTSEHCDFIEYATYLDNVK